MGCFVTVDGSRSPVSQWFLVLAAAILGLNTLTSAGLLWHYPGCDFRSRFCWLLFLFFVLFFPLNFKRRFMLLRDSSAKRGKGLIGCLICSLFDISPLLLTLLGIRN